MKGFKFKLEALLKVRKLKEDQCKMEIGRLQVERQKRVDDIQRQNEGIGQAYQDQEATINQGASGLDVQFYPYFVEGKRSNIRILEDEISKLDELIKDKTQELAKLRGDVKVLDSMKDKHKEQYKKDLNKKIDQDLEEQVQIWKNYR
jgi:flagellar FliJ protein